MGQNPSVKQLEDSKKVAEGYQKFTTIYTCNMQYIAGDDTMGTTGDIVKDNTSDDDTTTERITIKDVNISTEMTTSHMAVQDQAKLNGDVPT